MLRFTRRVAVAIQAAHTREEEDASGGVYRVVDGEPFTVSAVPLRTVRGLVIGETGVWGAPSRYILVEKDAGLRRHDRVTLPGAAGSLAVFDIREMPRHARVELREAP